MNTNPHVILVTGASSGIGRAIAERLASRGDVVFAGARKEMDIEALNQIENIQGVKLDVTRPGDIDEVIQRIEGSHGFLDGLVNNAGKMGWGAVIDREVDYYRSIFEVNMWGTISMVQKSYPLLRKSGKNPAIFNISSQGANYTLPFWSPYHMSKYAMEAFTGSLRRELMGVGIRVFSIAPGAYKSDMLKKQIEELGQYEQKYHSEFSSKVIKMLSKPVKEENERWQSPEVLGDLIFKVLHGTTTKARFEPGKRLIPDVLFEKLPAALLDKMVMKVLCD